MFVSSIGRAETQALIRHFGRFFELGAFAGLVKGKSRDRRGMIAPPLWVEVGDQRSIDPWTMHFPAFACAVSAKLSKGRPRCRSFSTAVRRLPAVRKCAVGAAANNIDRYAGDQP